MADTEFDAFALVTALQTTDLFLAKRGSGGINFTLASLMRNVPDGSVSAPGLAFLSDQNTGIWRPAADVLAFVTGGVERARIDASGNVGIGKSPETNLHVKANDNVTTTYPIWAENHAQNYVAGYGAYGMSNRVDVLNQSVDYTIDIGRHLKINTANSERLRIRDDGHISPGADNTQSFGLSGARWSVIYAGTGTINTSDAREKLLIEWREDRRAADRRIARRILDELGWFQWQSAIAEKGEAAARWHFGARAQRVWSIVADEGLCAPIVEDEAFGMVPDPKWQGPPPPAWLCYDIWDDEYEDVIGPITIIESQEITRDLPGLYNKDGSPASVTEMVDVEVQTEGPTGEKRLARPAGNRFGFRPDQLALFLLAHIHVFLADEVAARVALEDRMAALEAKLAA